jgi:hypothetical protein
MMEVTTAAETSELDLLIWIKVVPPTHYLFAASCAHYLQMSTDGDKLALASLMMMMIMMVSMAMVVRMMVMAMMIPG